MSLIFFYFHLEMKNKLISEARFSFCQRAYKSVLFEDFERAFICKNSGWWENFDKKKKKGLGCKILAGEFPNLWQLMMVPCFECLIKNMDFG